MKWLICALAFSAALTALPGVGWAQLNIVDDTTVNGGTLNVSPSGSLNIGNSSNPLLTLTSSATSNGVTAVNVGAFSNGRLRVEGGSVLTGSGNATVGNLDIGVATVTGSGSKWQTTSELRVGGSANGTLNILAGGWVADNFANVGMNRPGKALVSGPGSLWTNTFSVVAGNLNTGTVDVEAGGRVESNGLGAGVTVGSFGTFNVRDAASSWDFHSGFASIGQRGFGNFNLTGGADVVGAGASLGGFNTGNGTINVSGAGTTWTLTDPSIVNDFTVGSGGQGTLIVQNGAVFSNNETTVGAGATANGLVTVSGKDSLWTNRHALYVANSGHGSVEVLAGARMTSPFAEIAQYSDAVGKVTVGGIDLATNTRSTWDSPGGIVMGYESGAATLNVNSYGKVTSGSANAGGYISYATAQINVDGMLAEWIISGDLRLGERGTGTMNVLNGGYVESGFTILGVNNGALGNVLVGGANSLWRTTDRIQVSRGGVTVQNGGTINSTGVSVGVFGGINQITVEGSGSKWIDDSFAFSLTAGTVNMVVRDGAQMETSNVQFAGGLGSHTLATVTGAGSKWTSGAMTIGSVGGFGTLNIASNGVVQTGSLLLDRDGVINILPTGTLNVTSFGLASGKIVNNGTLIGTVSASAGGLIIGGGSFSNLAVTPSGVVSPGNSPGPMTSAVTSWQNTGTYLWEINGLEDFGGDAGVSSGWDFWDAGQLDIANFSGALFTIRVRSLTAGNSQGILDHWTPTESYQWPIATASNGAFASLSHLTLNVQDFQQYNSLGGGHFFLSGDGSNSLLLNFSPAAVPEPSGVALAILGALGLIAARRRWRGAK